MTCRLALALLCESGSAQGTAFTYQGRLNDGAVQANGTYDLRFTVYDSLSGGAVQSSALDALDVPITNGLFTVTLDFGAGAFPGADRWLDIAVRPGASTGGFTSLAPRQRVTAAPYAITANVARNLSGTITASQLPASVVTNGARNLNLSGTFSGGFGLVSNLNLAASAVTGNRLRFTDTPGSEQVYLRAARNLDLEVVNDATFWSGHDWTTVVDHDANWHVKHDAFFTSDNNLTVTAGNQLGLFSSGGIGLGTANPRAALHVYSGNTPTALRLQSAQGFGAGRLEFYSDPQGSGSEWRPAYIESTDNGGFTGGLSFHVNGTGFDQRLGDLEVMRLVNGRVGIGTANPSATLHVAGDVMAASFAGPEINVGTLSCASLLQYNQSTQEGDHFFTGPTRQMLNLDTPSFGDTIPGLGLQPANLYFRSSDSFSWFTGGAHSDTKYDPGVNFIFAGMEAMRLSDGILSIYGIAGERAYLGGDGAGNDVQLGSLSVGIDAVALWNAGSGQQMDLIARSAGFSGSVSFGSQTRQMLNLWGTGYGIGVQASTLYFRCNAGGANEGFSWYKGGTHNDAHANAGGGTELMHLVSGGLYVNGTFVSSSDRNTKENFKPVDSQAVLEKVAALPLSEWNYKADAGTRHVGPMAQDFHAAFGVGPDDKHIATVDADGVALAAIQGLNKKVDAQRAELQSKDARIAELEQRLAAIEAFLKK